MPARRGLAIAFLVLGTILALGYGFTRYTLPNHGGPAYGQLHSLLAGVLGDRPPTVPDAAGAFPIQPVDSTVQEFRHRKPGPPPSDSAVTSWLTTAVERDPPAVRAWLGWAVLSISVTSGDTVRTTLWRLTLHRDCPLVSRLHALAVGRASEEPRFLRLTADCPRLPEP